MNQFMNNEISLLNNYGINNNSNNKLTILEYYQSIQKENEKYNLLSTSPFILHNGWRRDLSISKLRKLKESNKNERFPHLSTFPYNHHCIGYDENELGIWDPFLPNTDNPWICQTILINHCRVNKKTKTQCLTPKLKFIDFYTELDISLGHYLHRLFRCEPCHNPRCKELLSNHTLSYSHNNGKILINLKQKSLINVTNNNNINIDNNYNHNNDKNNHHINNNKNMNNHNNNINSNNKKKHSFYQNNIVLYTKCNICKKIIIPPMPMTQKTFDMSFGKYLELFFYEIPIIPYINNHNECKHNIIKHHTNYFEYNNIVIEFKYFENIPFTVYTASDISTNWILQFEYYLNELNIVELVSKHCFAAFLVKIDELIGLIGELPIYFKI